MYTFLDIDSNSYEYSVSDMNTLENIVTSDFEDSSLAEKVDNNPAPAKQKASGKKSCFKHFFKNYFCFGCGLSNL